VQGSSLGGPDDMSNAVLGLTRSFCSGAGSFCFSGGFKGSAQVLREGALFERILASYRDGEPPRSRIRHVVLVKIERLFRSSPLPTIPDSPRRKSGPRGGNISACFDAGTRRRARHPPQPMPARLRLSGRKGVLCLAFKHDEVGGWQLLGLQRCEPTCAPGPIPSPCLC
jgi:hypothetical protein